MKLFKKVMLITTATLCFAMGIIGIIIPILPGIPFLLVGAMILASVSHTARSKMTELQRKYHTRFKQQHSFTDSYTLSFAEKLQLKFWQASATVLRWLR